MVAHVKSILDYTRRAGGPEGDFCVGIVSHFSIKTDATGRQRRYDLSQNVQEHKKFLFSHCQSVSNFSKKVKKASYPSRGLFVFFSSKFSKSVPNSRVRFRFFTDTTFRTFRYC